ncbi:MAG: TetR family transcriptional regulator [Hyphomicrobiales bacterium]|nr:TetR family transcriptional regulator [Hyphomicrobiales bacterium]
MSETPERLTRRPRPTDAGHKAQGRRAAGQDPIKRQQILAGAKRIFMSLGFEAASMNDITQEAGVSKGTIYVYFEDKEALFAALIQHERGAVLARIEAALDPAVPIAEALFEFGSSLSARLTAPEVIRAQRMVLGVAERMPRLASQFFGPQSSSGVTVLSRYLDQKVAAGLLAIPDTSLAARQFIDLSMAGFFKRCLFGIITDTPTPEEIDRVARSAVEMFLRYYGRE